MGFTTKFNWVLQIQPPEVLTVDCLHAFRKDGSRVFPIDTPIDLIDLKRTAIAKVKIKSFKNTNSETTGIFEILKIYAGVEKTVLTNYWIENE